jgi:hypothetical protein
MSKVMGGEEALADAEQPLLLPVDGEQQPEPARGKDEFGVLSVIGSLFSL